MLISELTRHLLGRKPEAVAELQDLSAAGRNLLEESGEIASPILPLGLRSLVLGEKLEQTDVDGLAELLAPLSPVQTALVLEGAGQPGFRILDCPVPAHEGDEDLLDQILGVLRWNLVVPQNVLHSRLELEKNRLDDAL